MHASFILHPLSCKRVSVHKNKVDATVSCSRGQFVYSMLNCVFMCTSHPVHPLPWLETTSRLQDSYIICKYRIRVKIPLLQAYACFFGCRQAYQGAALDKSMNWWGHHLLLKLHWGKCLCKNNLIINYSCKRDYSLIPPSLVCCRVKVVWHGPLWNICLWHIETSEEQNIFSQTAVRMPDCSLVDKNCPLKSFSLPHFHSHHPSRKECHAVVCLVFLCSAKRKCPSSASAFCFLRVRKSSIL